jgi:hypothetical protein
MPPHVIPAFPDWIRGGIQPHSDPQMAPVWIPAKNMPE